LGASAAGCALVGAVLIAVSAVRVRWPRNAPSEEEVPDLAAPRNRLWHIAGLVFLTAAWALLCVAGGTLDATPDVRIGLGGLLALWLGLALIQLPREGQARLSCTVPERPIPPRRVPAKSFEESRLVGQVERLRAWVDRLLAAPEPARPGSLSWNEVSLEDPLPKMFGSRWRSQLAEVFKRELASSERSLAKMSSEAGIWAERLLAVWSDANGEPVDPLHLFCLCPVQRWLEDKPLEHLIGQLDLNPQMLVSAVIANVPPRWPQTRDDPEVDSSVIAVGKELWDIIAPFVDPSDSHRFALVDWQDPRTVAVVRIVQGLTSGWRGYPGLPTAPRAE